MSFHQVSAKLAISAPLYRQVRDLLADRISAGEWSPGQTLPNEGILAEEFGVSIGTVRRAVQSLEDIGVVSRKQGRGTFVTAPDLPSALEDSLCRIRSRDGTALRLGRHYLRTAYRQSQPEESAIFKWADDGDLVEVSSLLLAGGPVIGTERAMIPHYILGEVGTDIDMDEGANAALRRRRVQIARSDETVSIVEAEPAELSALRLMGAAYVLQVCRVAYTSTGEAVEIRITCYRPDAVVYRTSLG